MDHEIIRRRGADLKVGDTIRVWWGIGRDTIIDLRPYSGPLTCFSNGAFLAEFALNPVGMTIESDRYFHVVGV